MRKFYLMLTICMLAAPAHATTPIPDADSPQAKVYAEKCSICHVLPHPKRLSFNGWKHMLTLMDQRIQERGLSPLEPEERKAIAAYLERHAR
ncbi:MAG: diheme cytochrome c [Mariprofundaceae bacterium]|nr:diheme cytochrome c [Mariprofundaceae bacterium]